MLPWPSRGEAVNALYGLYRMVWLDPAAVQHFDRSATGARRSLVLIGLAVPLAALGAALAAMRAGLVADVPLAALATRLALEFVIAWAGFLLLMRLVSMALERPERFAGFAVLFNWVAAARYLFAATGSFVALVTGPPFIATSILTAISLPLLLLAEGYAYRQGLAVPIIAAVGLVVLRLLFDALVRTLL